MTAAAFIRDPTFALSQKAVRWTNCVRVAPDWFAEFIPTEQNANQSLVAASGGGLTLQWEAAPKRIRLWQPFDAPPTSAGVGPVSYTVILTFSSRFSPARDIVEWIGFLEEGPGKNWLFHSKFRRHITKRDGKYVFTAVANDVRLHEAGKYRLCVQFGACPKKLFIHSVEGILQAGPASASRPEAPIPGSPNAPHYSYHWDGKSLSPTRASGGVISKVSSWLRNAFKGPYSSTLDDPFDPFD